jgi:DNA invertase Pin-like site-specific DNA recombinase
MLPLCNADRLRQSLHRRQLSPQQQAEIRKMVSKGDKTATDAARLFKIHPATVLRLLAREPHFKTAYAK